MEHFLKVLNEYTFCSWLVMPLIGMNPSQFGGSNFVNSYLDRENMLLVVDVKNSWNAQRMALYPGFLEQRSHGTRVWMIYRIPEKWTDDIALFCAGKYSRLSEDAQYMIRRYSGLKYMHDAGDGRGPVTDVMLMALERHPTLIQYWTDMLEVSEEELPRELLSPPGEATFVHVLFS